MIINTLKLNWPNEQPQNARLQIRIGEAAHADRDGSSRSDWVDAAHYVINERPPVKIRRHYRSRGVKWHDLYRAAATVANALGLAS